MILKCFNDSALLLLLSCNGQREVPCEIDVFCIAN